MLLLTAAMLLPLLLLLPPTLADSPWTSLLDGSRHFVGDSESSSTSDDDNAASKYGAVWEANSGATPSETETETGWTRKSLILFVC
jgi:hypothetical protein